MKGLRCRVRAPTRIEEGEYFVVDVENARVLLEREPGEHVQMKCNGKSVNRVDGVDRTEREIVLEKVIDYLIERLQSK